MAGDPDLADDRGDRSGVELGRCRCDRAWRSLQRSARRRSDDRRRRTTRARRRDATFRQCSRLTQCARTLHADRALYLLQSGLSVRRASVSRRKRRPPALPARSFPTSRWRRVRSCAPRWPRWTGDAAARRALDAAERAARIADAATGFVYVVSRLGVTGAGSAPDFAPLRRQLGSLRDADEQTARGRLRTKPSGGRARGWRVRRRGRRRQRADRRLCGRSRRRCRAPRDRFRSSAYRGSASPSASMTSPATTPTWRRWAARRPAKPCQ